MFPSLPPRFAALSPASSATRGLLMGCDNMFAGATTMRSAGGTALSPLAACKNAQTRTHSTTAELLSSGQKHHHRWDVATPIGYRAASNVARRVLFRYLGGNWG